MGGRQSSLGMRAQEAKALVCQLEFEINLAVETVRWVEMRCHCRETDAIVFIMMLLYSSVYDFSHFCNEELGLFSIMLPVYLVPRGPVSSPRTIYDAQEPGICTYRTQPSSLSVES